MKHVLALLSVVIVLAFLGLMIIETITGAQAPLAGNFNVTGGGTYRLYSSVGKSQTTLTLSSFKEPTSNTPYTMSYINTDIGYGTIDPNSNSLSEFVSFSGITQNSDGTATLTGVSRGLARTPGSGGCVASSTLAQAHSGQAIFILSNSPCFQSEYVPLRTTSTSSAVQVFGSTTPPRFDADPGATAYNAFPTSVFVDQAQLARTALAGTVNATTLVNGVVQLATALQMASSTQTGSSGANNVMQAGNATDTPQRGCAVGYSATAGAGCSPVALLSGKLHQSWLDLTAAFTWAGTHIFNGAVTFNSTVAFNSTTSGLSWQLLTSTTTTVTLSGATTSSFTAKNNLMIVINTTATGGAQSNRIVFNSDMTSGGYGFQDFESGVRQVTSGSTNGIALDAGTTTPEFYTVMVSNNLAGTRKFVTWNGTTNGSAALSPVFIMGAGVWNNTSSQITQVSLASFGVTTYPAGLTIAVYGAN